MLEAQIALDAIRVRIQQEHTACGRVVQQFYGNAKFEHLHNKIWKYDWSPAGVRGAGRKSWRLIVVVPSPEQQPFGLIASAFYSKSSESQLPTKELARIFAAIVTPVTFNLAASEDAEGEFRRLSNGDGNTRSICSACFESVAVSADPSVIAIAEAGHTCLKQK